MIWELIINLSYVVIESRAMSLRAQSTFCFLFDILSGPFASFGNLQIVKKQFDHHNDFESTQKNLSLRENSKKTMKK